MEILSTSGIVYVLTNDCMPGLVKIGKSYVGGLDQRIKTLYQEASGVPGPFTLHYALVVENEDMAYKIESRMHDLFAPDRVNERREFFRVAPERVVQALLPIIDVGGGVPYEKPVERVVEEEEKIKERKNPPIRFYSIGLKDGDLLTFTRDTTIQCKIVADKKVEYQGQTTSLSALAYSLLSKIQGSALGYNVSGPMFWMYEGETLDERRAKLESEEEKEEELS